MAGAQLWGYDATNKKWIPLVVDANGYVKVDLSNINLDDLANVSVAAPTSGHIIYWDNATSLWKCKAPTFLALSDTPAAFTNQAGKGLKVNAGATALEFARMLLAPTGADWKDRSYEGWEVVDTATTYTVGAGKDFATLADAAASLQNLILAAVVTVQLEEDIALTSQVLFQNMISKAAGRLELDLNNYDITINFNGQGILFYGPFEAWILDGTGAAYASIKAGASAAGSTYLVRWWGAVGLTKDVDFDRDGKDIAAMLAITNTAVVYLHSNTSFSDTAGGGSCTYGVVLATLQGWMSAIGTVGIGADDFTVLNGSFAIDSAGHIHTEAGEISNTQVFGTAI